jgi:hypothetical protein
MNATDASGAQALNPGYYQLSNNEGNDPRVLQSPPLAEQPTEALVAPEPLSLIQTPPVEGVGVPLIAPQPRVDSLSSPTPPQSSQQSINPPAFPAAAQEIHAPVIIPNDEIKLAPLTEPFKETAVTAIATPIMHPAEPTFVPHAQPEPVVAPVLTAPAEEPTPLVLPSAAPAAIEVAAVIPLSTEAVVVPAPAPATVTAILPITPVTTPEVSNPPPVVSQPEKPIERIIRTQVKNSVPIRIDQIYIGKHDIVGGQLEDLLGRRLRAV